MPDLDLVERLRNLAEYYTDYEETLCGAADEIERLRAELDGQTRQAGKFFAENCRLEGEIERLQKAMDDMEQEHHEIANWKQREIERLRADRSAMLQALGYPVPADEEVINNPYRCGMCDARALKEKPDAV